MIIKNYSIKCNHCGKVLTCDETTCEKCGLVNNRLPIIFKDGIWYLGEEQVELKHLKDIMANEKEYWEMVKEDLKIKTLKLKRKNIHNTKDWLKFNTLRNMSSPTRALEALYQEAVKLETMIRELDKQLGVKNLSRTKKSWLKNTIKRINKLLINNSKLTSRVRNNISKHHDGWSVVIK